MKKNFCQVFNEMHIIICNRKSQDRDLIKTPIAALPLSSEYRHMPLKFYNHDVNFFSRKFFTEKLDSPQHYFPHRLLF